MEMLFCIKLITFSPNHHSFADSSISQKSRQRKRFKCGSHERELFVSEPHLHHVWAAIYEPLRTHQEKQLQGWFRSRFLRRIFVRFKSSNLGQEISQIFEWGVVDLYVTKKLGKKYFIRHLFKKESEINNFMSYMAHRIYWVGRKYFILKAYLKLKAILK